MQSPHGINQISPPIVLVTYNVEQNQSEWRLGGAVGFAEWAFEMGDLKLTAFQCTCVRLGCVSSSMTRQYHHK